VLEIALPFAQAVVVDFFEGIVYFYSGSLGSFYLEQTVSDKVMLSARLFIMVSLNFIFFI